MSRGERYKPVGPSFSKNPRNPSSRFFSDTTVLSSGLDSFRREAYTIDPGDFGDRWTTRRPRGVREFFNALWSDFSTPGNVTIWTNPGRESFHVPLARLGAFTDEDIGELRALNRTKNIYAGLGLRVDGLTKKQQGGKQQITALPGLVLDIDVLSKVKGAHAAGNLPEDKDEALEVILAGAPDPTMIVWSGYGWQPHWVFKKPWILTTAADRKRAGAAFEAFQQPFIERGLMRGWQVDSTATIQRVWRVPGFDNLKGGQRSPATLEYCDPTVRYDITELVPSYQPAAARSQPRSSAPRPAAAAPPASPNIELAKVINAMRALDPEHQNKAAMDKILAGESFADSGSRDAELQAVCSTIVWMSKTARKMDPTVLARVLEPSLTVWVNEPNSEKTIDEELAKAAEKLARAQEDFIAKEARQAPQLEALSRALRKSLGNNAADPDPTNSGPEHVPAFVRQHAIIQHKTTFFVFNFNEPTGYSHALIRDEVLTYARDAWEHTAVLDLTYLNDKDVEKQKTLARVLMEYATNARRIVGDMTLQSSYFSTDEREFYHAVVPLRDLAPRYDKHIAEWLSLLTDDEHKLLDWLATCMQLDKPSCALYLSGATGSGKNLLSIGIARLFRAGGPALLENVIGGFNADLFKCPLIYVDEGLPAGVKDISIKLRALIGATSFTSTEKYLANHDVIGSIRLLIGANNEAVLAMGSEDMTAEDMKAVANRFLHLKAQDAAADWLILNNPGQCLTRHWIAGDLLARHVLWLRDNRTVVAGDRFIVEGESTDIHRRLLMQGDRDGIIFEWIARFVDDPGLLTKVYTTRKEKPLALVGDGEILINSQSVADGWGLYMDKDSFKCPSTSVIGRVLKKLARGLAPGKRRYHDIKPGLILGWAADMQVGDTENMEKNIKREDAYAAKKAKRAKGKK